MMVMPTCMIFMRVLTIYPVLSTLVQLASFKDTDPTLTPPLECLAMAAALIAMGDSVGHFPHFNGWGSNPRLMEEIAMAQGEAEHISWLFHGIVGKNRYICNI